MVVIKNALTTRRDGMSPRGRSKALVIQYYGVDYPVVSVDSRRILGEEVVRHRLDDGTYFERWTRQGTLIPPWVMQWYQLGDKPLST